MSNWIWGTIVFILVMWSRFLWKNWHEEMDWRMHYVLMWNSLTSELSEDNKAVLRSLERLHGQIKPYQPEQTRHASEVPVKESGSEGNTQNQEDLRITEPGLVDCNM